MAEREPDLNPAQQHLPLSESDVDDSEEAPSDLEERISFEQEDVESPSESSSHGEQQQQPVLLAVRAITSLTMTLRWLAQDQGRSDLDAAGMAVAIRKEDRHTLSADALLKLQRASIEGMTHKFFLMGNSKEDQLVQCYNLALRVEELKLHMKKTDIISALEIFATIIPAPLPAGTAFPTPFPASLSLFDKVGEALTEAHVRGAMRFKRYYGQAYDIQDLQWSQEFLENSCEEDLRIKVLERTRTFPDVEQGGALFYHVMIRLIQSDVERAARGLIVRLEKMTLRSLSGENIFVACSLIRGVYDKLLSIGKVPDDIDNTILRIMQTSSVDEFNDVFKTLSHNNLLDLGIKKTPSEILDLAEKIYKIHLEPESPSPWKGAGRVGKSTFVTETEMAANTLRSLAATQTDTDGVECWQCGAKGHLSRDCPNPASGRGGGRGRGAGRRTGRDTPAWKRTPPAAGEPGTKVIEGVTWYWCGTCTYWNRTHTTVQHVAKSDRPVNVATTDASTVATADTSVLTTGATTVEPDKGRVSFYGTVLNKMNTPN